MAAKSSMKGLLGEFLDISVADVEKVDEDGSRYFFLAKKCLIQTRPC